MPTPVPSPMPASSSRSRTTSWGKRGSWTSGPGRRGSSSTAAARAPTSPNFGARARLTRVGVYYHDIGKVARPQYFIENQPKGLNPHDRIRPSQSAEILRDHVREGLALADEAKLPGVLKDFIREHHGTQQIRYFLAKAREDEGSLDFDPNDFCYPGPKPQSKETAIVMRADAVESKSPSAADQKSVLKKVCSHVASPVVAGAPCPPGSPASELPAPQSAVSR